MDLVLPKQLCEVGTKFEDLYQPGLRFTIKCNNEYGSVLTKDIYNIQVHIQYTTYTSATEE